MAISSSSLFKICLLTFLINIIVGMEPSGDQILAEIKKANTPFTNETINQFIALVREKYNYDMIDVCSSSHPEKYSAIRNNTNDVQILSSGSNHFKCIYFDASHKKIYIYDSKYATDYLDNKDEYNLILQNWFPWAVSTVHVLPRTEQYDDTSSGPFVIAYATTLILGQNPATYNFRMNATHSDKSIHLREHIFEMLRTRELSLFPRSDRLDINYISPALDKIHPNVLNDINTPNRCFSLHTINHFIDLATATTNFDMVYMNFISYPEFYPVHNDTKNDVQIVYYYEGNSVGHAMCIFYDTTKKKVVVYDHKKLYMSLILMIRRRYPNYKSISYIRPKMIQQDLTSCGPFTIAYATTLILGYDPKTYKFKTPSLSASSSSRGSDQSTFLRKHILKMFQSKKLLPFPQD